MKQMCVFILPALWTTANFVLSLITAAGPNSPGSVLSRVRVAVPTVRSDGLACVGALLQVPHRDAMTAIGVLYLAAWLLGCLADWFAIKKLG